MVGGGAWSGGGVVGGAKQGGATWGRGQERGLQSHMAGAARGEGAMRGCTSRPPAGPVQVPAALQLCGPACEPQGPVPEAPPSVRMQARWCGHAVAFTCRCPCAWEAGPRRTGRGLPCYLRPQPPPRGEDVLFRQLPGFLASWERGSVLPRQWGPSYSSSSLLLSCQPGGARVGRGGGGGSWPGRKAGCREGRSCMSPPYHRLMGVGDADG